MPTGIYKRDYQKIYTTERNKKISEARKKRKEIFGYLNSEETRRKLSEIRKKNPIRYWLGKKRNQRDRKKMSEAAKKPERILITIKNLPKHEKGYNSGKENPNWKGGISEIRRKECQEKIAGRKRSERCAICGSIKRICFDHDHNTGKFRGWICHKCNIILGFVNDDKNILQKIIDYINRNNLIP